MRLTSGAITEIVGSRIRGPSGFGIVTQSTTAEVTTTTSVTDTTLSRILNSAIISYITVADAVARILLTRVTANENGAAFVVEGGPTASITVTGSTAQGNN